MADSPKARLEAMLVIADFSRNGALSRVLKKSAAPVFFLTHGQGAAKSAIFEILGYGESKKVVALSIQTKTMSDYLFRELQKKLEFNKPGTAVAFTIGLSSASGALLTTCRQTEEILKMGSEDMAATCKAPYHLVVTVISSGYFEKVMEVARAAGATGGTAIHARGLGSQKAMKYLGITIHPEKELVLILVKQENRLAIMETITRELGLNMAGMGICFSLPVTDALGLGAEIQLDREL
jgi:nitrogen regulatory protein PII